MIGRLRGLIIEKMPPEVLLEVSGVAYEIQMPMTCFYELAEVGQEITLFTHFVVREDAQLLYGFNHKQERTLFRELIKVNGVGPKLALAILSGMSAAHFINAIEHEKVSSLVKLPGIGRKTAERLIIEMKDRIKGLTKKPEMHTSLMDSSVLFTQQIDHELEAISALVSLGYRQQDAQKMVNKVSYPEADCEALIREALRAAL